MTPSPLLRARDVAELLGISRAMVFRLAETGKIRSIAFHGWDQKKPDQKQKQTIRFEASAIEEFLRNHRRAAG